MSLKGMPGKGRSGGTGRSGDGHALFGANGGGPGHVKLGKTKSGRARVKGSKPIRGVTPNLNTHVSRSGGHRVTGPMAIRPGNKPGQVRIRTGARAQVSERQIRTGRNTVAGGLLVGGAVGVGAAGYGVHKAVKKIRTRSQTGGAGKVKATRLPKGQRGSLADLKQGYRSGRSNGGLVGNQRRDSKGRYA